MRHIDACPVCGSSPIFAVKKHIDLNRVEGIMRQQYLGYNMKLCGESIPNEHFAICGKCLAIYRALHFTDNEIKAIYTSLYLNFEDKFQDTIIYNDKKLLDGCSARMYEKVKDIERAYDTVIRDVFDIGGRDGFRLVKLADNGYNCTVYDPIPKEPCSEKIDKRNIWSNELKKDEKADLIVLCNVLEHCINPRGLMDDCHMHLNEKGFLFLEIPLDFDAFFDWLLCYQLFKKPLGIDVTHHVFFSKRSVVKLLKDGKFIVKKISYNKLPVCGVKVMEILAQKCSPQQVEYSAITRRVDLSFLILLVSLAKVFPRITLNAVDRCYRKLLKTLLRSRHEETLILK